MGHKLCKTLYNLGKYDNQDDTIHWAEDDYNHAALLMRKWLKWQDKLRLQSWRIIVYSPSKYSPIYNMTLNEDAQIVFFGSVYFWDICSLIFALGLTGDVS